MKEKESVLSGHLQPTRHDTRCFNFYKKVAIINMPILQKMKMTLKMIKLVVQTWHWSSWDLNLCLLNLKVHSFYIQY